MSDMTNLLPLDPAWAKQVNRIAKSAAKQLKCTVLLIAIQENGKLGAALEGVPESGPLRDAVTDIPNFLESLACVVEYQEQTARARPMQ